MPTFEFGHDSQLLDSAGIPEYLTRIIASPLLFIADPNEQDHIWELASRRLSERCGRTAMSAMTRAFSIWTTPSRAIDVRIHEPTLLGDDLGLKTWGTAYVLARQLHLFQIPSALRYNTLPDEDAGHGMPQILELGSGTGLVGIAAAAIWQQHVLLTDLPSIVSNLSHNIDLNATLLENAGSRATCATLDWSQPLIITKYPPSSESTTQAPAIPANHFRFIIVADPIYDPMHPRLVVEAIKQNLHPAREVRILVAYPIREAYASQIIELTVLLREIGLTLMAHGIETGRDDWQSEIEVKWVLWCRGNPVLPRA